jgi:hypothetical protein
LEDIILVADDSGTQQNEKYVDFKLNIGYIFTPPQKKEKKLFLVYWRAVK